jgi:hypothetical protein
MVPKAAPVGQRPAGHLSTRRNTGKVIPLKLGTNIGIGVATNHFPVLDDSQRHNANSLCAACVTKTVVRD